MKFITSWTLIKYDLKRYNSKFYTKYYNNNRKKFICKAPYKNVYYITSHVLFPERVFK